MTIFVKTVRVGALIHEKVRDSVITQICVLTNHFKQCFIAVDETRDYKRTTNPTMRIVTLTDGWTMTELECGKHANTIQNRYLLVIVHRRSRQRDREMEHRVDPDNDGLRKKEFRGASSRYLGYTNIHRGGS